MQVSIPFWGVVAKCKHRTKPYGFVYEPVQCIFIEQEPEHDAPWSERLEHRLRNWFIRRYKAHEDSGLKTSRFYRLKHEVLRRAVELFRGYMVVNLDTDIDGKVLLCLRCIEAMTIQCAYCDQAIPVGARVVLHERIEKNVLPHAEDIVLGTNEKGIRRTLVVCCGRSPCTIYSEHPRLHVHGRGEWVAGDGGKGRLQILRGR